MLKSSVIYSKITRQLITESDTHDVPATIAEMHKGNLDMELFHVRQWAVKKGLIKPNEEIVAFD
ncbi:hypothetical protein [Solemya velum gill symbiont]|uniref:Uncharacterized protein n=2 Tax=Solemya velum gill symbiont TaxID=2340 RepID=A0A0B0H7V0_SOVGS|nr:hypothetical protein [Solemya velum gill symbiont]KHF24732.1 hypothetical protein JV46_07990 [Solemya velum gill symbiont]OOY34756.1 hypothetical protein BOV88_08305 [Solemya velum gill symbiont]OOY37648.1 hypothetical protein BOV89_06270 [Solemya velum gill symbiont]OOY39086.1 hypothetical protein BOV90_11180 [Solemya velum gill symbiont]OOY44064.1 hypothetical protein BOV91_02360 [Solemya velum gill symbiont]